MPVQEEGELTPARAMALHFLEHGGRKARSHSQSVKAAGLGSGKSWNQTQKVTMGFWPQSKKGWASPLSKL